jgi:hypothetical protein
MQVQIYDKTTNGLPGAIIAADLSGRLDEVAFTHAALWGPLTASVQWSGALTEAFQYADQYLGNRIAIYSPTGDWLWEGLIWAVVFGAGSRQRTRALESYANLARVHYRATDFSTSPPTDLGIATPAVAQDTAGQATYGVIEYQQNEGGMLATTASSLAAAALNMRKHLLYQPGTGSSAGGATVELQCIGFYRTLFYQAYTAATVNSADVAAVVKNILTAKGPFISADQSQVATTGITTGQQFDQYEMAGDIIKRLVTSVDGWTFGLDQGAVPYLRASRRYAVTPDYVERLDGIIESNTGQELPLWNVRPDSILRQADFVPVSANLSAATESVEHIYLVETTYSTQNGGELTYQPAVTGPRGEILP